MPERSASIPPKKVLEVQTSPDTGTKNNQVARPNNRRILLAAGALSVVTILVYLNSFSGRFVFDDLHSIQTNPHIKRLWPWREAFAAPIRSPVRDRPVINLTLSLNYAWGRYNPFGYHALNLAIHLGAALLLLGVARRTFLTERLKTRYGESSLPLAFSIALLWAVHPLQTESVTYISQRSESLMGFFYLGLIYCLIRGSTASRKFGWYLTAFVFSALGMGTKATMVTAPLTALFYDRIFLCRTWKEVGLKRGRLYVALAATWLILGGLVATTPYPEITSHTPLGYARSQPGIILHYLRLVFWPHRLCLDYGWPVAQNLEEILPAAVCLLGLLWLTAWALARKPALGFLGLWFFLILSPTSSFLPLEDLAFEHRIYLPLAAVVTALVIAVYHLLCLIFPRQKTPRTILGAVLLSIPTVLFGAVTLDRNEDYRTPVSIWAEVLALRPDNPRACNNLGNSFLADGRHEEAAQAYEAAIRLQPDWWEVYNNLGVVRYLQGKVEEATALYRKSLRIEPENAEAYYNLGIVLAGKGEIDAAVSHYRQALRVRPDYADAHNNLANLFARSGKPGEAVKHYRQALRADPDYLEARLNLAATLTRLGRKAEAEEHYREALRIKEEQEN